MILIIIFFIFIYLFFSINKDIIKIKSDIDNNYYYVLNFYNKKKASNTLAILKKNAYLLQEHLEKNIDKYEYFKNNILLLKKNLHKLLIQENFNKYNTSYVQRKQNLYLCIRSKKDKKIHNINLLMNILLHELAHISNPTYGHDEEFTKIFYFYIYIAKKINLYKDIEQNTEYCGIFI